jgi:hypothetical protein
MKAACERKQLNDEQREETLEFIHPVLSSCLDEVHV